MWLFFFLLVVVVWRENSILFWKMKKKGFYLSKAHLARIQWSKARIQCFRHLLFALYFLLLFFLPNEYNFDVNDSVCIYLWDFPLHNLILFFCSSFVFCRVTHHLVRQKLISNWSNLERVHTQRSSKDTASKLNI